MSSFMKTYGKALFTLVLIAILIVFAGPLGLKIKNATTEKVSTTEEIGNDEVYVTTTGRPKRPKEAVDKVWCYLDKNEELVISQNKITAHNDAIVKEKQVSKPKDIISDTTQIKTVRFDGAVMPKSCDLWFNSCANLTEIKNIENLYTNECTSMSCMFYNCSKLKEINLNNFDTSKVQYAIYMFYNCSSLTNINLQSFDTSNMTEISGMFCGCKNLTEINICNFDTSKCNNMFDMFGNCTNLRKINLSSFNTTNVTNMWHMFYGCKNLSTLDLSNFDISNVTSLTEMFSISNKLTSVKVSQATYDKLKTVSNLGITMDKFDIVK